MGLQHYTQDMSRIPIKYHTNVLFYTKYTHPTLICRGADARMDGRTHGRSENIYSIFRDKLLLLGEHIYRSRDGSRINDHPAAGPLATSPTPTTAANISKLVVVVVVRKQVSTRTDSKTHRILC